MKYLHCHHNNDKEYHCCTPCWREYVVSFDASYNVIILDHVYKQAHDLTLIFLPSPPPDPKKLYIEIMKKLQFEKELNDLIGESE